MTIKAWALAIMIAASPPERAVAVTTHPDARETAAERLERYEGIAAAVARVVSAPGVHLPYSGRFARARTAALLLAVSWFESGWRKDVDLGVGKLSRGEGVDSCLMQIRVGSGKTAEGWDHADLTADRDKCFTSGLRKLARSFAQCRSMPLSDRLSAYAAGVCDSDRGRADSRKKFALADRWTAKNPPRNADDDDDDDDGAATATANTH